MNNKMIIRILVIITWALTLVACTPGYVKDTIESNSPGAQLISAQKAVIPAGESDDEAWCVVSQRGGIKTRWLVKQATIAGGETVILNFLEPPEEDFIKFSCTNWNE